MGAAMRLEWQRSHAPAPAEFSPAPGSADPLGDFLVWYGEHGPAFPAAPAAGLWYTAGLPGVTLYSCGAFQAQLFIFPADTIVPEHRHPHVDTIEMHLAGDFDFRVGGLPAIPADHFDDRRGGVSRWWGRGVRVRPHVWHDVRVGARGAAFLSLQHWLEGRPTTVGLDWEGAPVNDRHGSQLGR